MPIGWLSQECEVLDLLLESAKGATCESLGNTPRQAMIRSGWLLEHDSETSIDDVLSIVKNRVSWEPVQTVSPSR